MNITNLQGSIGLLHSSEPKSDAITDLNYINFVDLFNSFIFQ